MRPRRPDSPFPAHVWAEALRHVGLVSVVARSHLGHGLGLDDLVQEGLIGACRAIVTYDPSLGKLAPHLARWARHAMQDAIWRGALVRRTARASRRKARWSPDAAAALGRIRDRAPRLDPGAWAAVLAAIDELPGREAQAIRLRYGLDGDPARYREAAAVLGCSHQTVANLESRALARLREALTPG